MFYTNLFCLIVLTLCAVRITKAYCDSKVVPAYRGQVQCSSGDSEVMIINFDLLPGETEDSKASKIAEAFQIVEDRREENHEKWLAIKKKAQEENEKKVENGEDLKLRSVTEN